MSPSTPTWPELQASHPIIALFQKLPEILSAAEGYNEVWGIKLVAPTNPSPANGTTTTAAAATNGGASAVTSDAASATPSATTMTDKPTEQPPFHTALILQKFLRANSNDLAKAYSQLKDTLVWRKSFFSPGGESSKGWSDAKFAGMGYTTTITVDRAGDKTRKVVSWNIYGAAKDIKAAFGNLDEFIRWRVNLMESSLRLLQLERATEPIPDFGCGDDPYQSLQVHDYMNVSFLRLPSEVKAASRKTIQTFARYYPETLERKFFVNVPIIMSWVYLLMKRVVATETMRKLEMLGAGKELAHYLGPDIPEEYGGSAQPLEAGDHGVYSPKDVDGEAAAAAGAATRAEDDGKKKKKEEEEGENKKEHEDKKEKEEKKEAEENMEEERGKEEKGEKEKEESGEKEKDEGDKMAVPAPVAATAAAPTPVLAPAPANEGQRREEEARTEEPAKTQEPVPAAAQQQPANAEAEEVAARADDEQKAEPAAPVAVAQENGDAVEPAKEATEAVAAPDPAVAAPAVAAPAAAAPAAAAIEPLPLTPPAAPTATITAEPVPAAAAVAVAATPAPVADAAPPASINKEGEPVSEKKD